MPAGSTGLFTPGPAEIAVAIPSLPDMLTLNDTFSYLGTTVNGARSRKILYGGNVQGDPAGVDGQPLDFRLSGRGIVTVVQVNKFDPTVMGYVENRFYTGAPGSVGPNEIGSLALTEGVTIAVMIRSRYATSGHTQFVGYTAGLRILFAIVTGEVGEDRGTKEQVYDLTFTGFTNLCLPPNNTLYGKCWDNTIANFPVVT
jgi:hypothetical protein